MGVLQNTLFMQMPLCIYNASVNKTNQKNTLYPLKIVKNKNKNKNKFISEQKMKFHDNEILLINILLKTHTMGTTAIT